MLKFSSALMILYTLMTITGSGEDIGIRCYNKSRSSTETERFLKFVMKIKILSILDNFD